MQLTTTNAFSGLEDFVTENVLLSRHTWYKIGGPARYFVRPRSVEELQIATRRCTENSIPIYVLGAGANLLVGDEGVAGAVFRLDDSFWMDVDYSNETLKLNAGVDMYKLVSNSSRVGLTGLEKLAGIPGTLGGIIRMNAGGKFGDISTVIQDVTIMDSDGTISVLSKDEVGFEYRKTHIAEPFVIGATLKLDFANPEETVAKYREIWLYKRNSQPLSGNSCGCIFKNPEGKSAGALIDQAGLKGLRNGQAQVSDMHANFILAYDGCRASEVKDLIKTVQMRVYDKHQILLETEVKIWP